MICLLTDQSWALNFYFYIEFEYNLYIIYLDVIYNLLGFSVTE